MLRRILGTTMVLGWMAATIGCGNSKVETKPNFEPKAPPKAASGAEKVTGTASDGD